MEGSGQAAMDAADRTNNSASNSTGVENDSSPLNFETFVPTHDASLSFAVPPHPPPLPSYATAFPNGITAAADYGSSSHVSEKGQSAGATSGCSAQAAARASEPTHTAISADEAFNRALGAMYWCGYWTAQYHVRDSYRRLGELRRCFVDRRRVFAMPRMPPPYC